MVWLMVAGASLEFRGGEFISLAVALLPGIVMGKIFGVWSHSGNDFTWVMVLGGVAMLGLGYLLDWTRVSLKTFFISFLIGIVVTYGLIAVSFVAEAQRIGSVAGAANRFDFNKPERVIAWQVLCTALGLYLGIAGAFLARAVQAGRSASQGRGEGTGA